MKKIMICAITLLPLMILLIMIGSAAVVSLSTHIYVENLEFVNEKVVLQKTSDDPVSAELKWNVFPKLASNPSVTFKSMDESIVTVDENGKVTGHDFGETLVYVISEENQTKQASCKVVVTDDKIHRISVTNPVTEMTVGQTHALETTFSPSEAVNVRLIFTSDNPEILEVSPDGVLTANPSVPGKATITVSSEGNPSATASFSVKVRVPAEGITIADDSPVTVNSTTYPFPTVEVYPSTAEVKLIYSSSDDSVATVDQNGLITFHKAESAVISVRAEGYDGDNFAVSKKITSTMGYFQSVVFDKNSIETDYAQNKVLDLAFTTMPAQGNSEYISVSFSESGVAAYENGKFVVKGGGITVVSVTVQKADGSTATATANVKVNRKAEDIAFYNADGQKTAYFASLSKSFTLKTQLLPVDSTERIVSFVSSDSSVATVDGEGRVLFVGDGYAEAVITATSESGLVRTMTVAYFPQSANPVKVEKGTKIVDLEMPEAAKEQKIVFAPYVSGAGISSVEYVFDGTCATLDGAIVTISDKGTARLTVKVNGEVYTDLTLNVVRRVERLENVSLVAVWDNETADVTVVSGGSVYVSAKEVRISASVYPATATVSQPTIKVESDSAKLSGGVLTFEKAGKALLTISADGKEYSVSVESTFMHPDAETEFDLSPISIEKGGSLDLNSLIRKINPYGADLSYVSFAIDGDCAEIVENTRLNALFGGVATLTISVETATGVLSHTVAVTVNEKPTDISIAQKVYYARSAHFDLTGLYSVLPTTANYLDDVSYSIVGECDFASVDDGKLTFTAAGLAKVEIATQNGIKGYVAVVYGGSNETVSAYDGVTEREAGKAFVLQLSDEDLASVADALEFGFVADNSGVTVSSGAVITPVAAGDFEIAVAGKTYKFKAIIKTQSIGLSFADTSRLDEGYLTADKSVKINSTVLPADATYKTLEWSSSNGAVAEYDAETGVLTFKKAGAVTLTAVEPKSGVKASIMVESTFGAARRLTLTSDKAEFEFDNADASKNVFDLTRLFEVYPHTAEKSSVSATSLSSENGTADGVLLTVNKGGEFEVLLSTESGDQKKLTVSVLRSATDVLLGSTRVSEILSTAVLENAFVFLRTDFYPSDANRDLEITYNLTEQSLANAKLDGARLVFLAENAEVAVEFKVGGKLVGTVKFVTTSLISTATVDGETVVVPTGDKFAWYSEEGEVHFVSADGIEITSDGRGNYVSAKSGVGELTYTLNGIEYTKKIVSTLQAESIEGLFVKDVLADGTEAVVTNLDNQHNTASKTLLIGGADLGSALNADGTKPTVSYKTNDKSVATVSADGTLTFVSGGRVTVTVTAVGNDFYGEYSITKSFNVWSTNGAPTGVEVTGPTDVVADDYAGDFDFAKNTTVKQPKYGVISPEFEYVSSDEGIAKVSKDGILTVVGAGKVTITVQTADGKGGLLKKEASFRVDKRIDKITFTDGGDEVGRVVVKTSEYSLDYALKSLTATEPTLTGVSVTSSDGSVATVVGNVVKFAAAEGAVKITVKATDGNASAVLQVVRVAEAVEILRIDDATEKVVLHAGRLYVEDSRFGAEDVWFDFAAKTDYVQEVNSTTKVFKALKGGEFVLTSSGRSLEAVVTEDVSSIAFTTDAGNVLSAKESFDLGQIYGAHYLPATARTEDAPYTLTYTVKNLTGEATVTESGVLTFKKAGEVEVTFSAGGKSVSRHIESTMGYAKSVAFTPEKTKFEYADGSYTFTEGRDYVVTPSDATKAGVSFATSDAQVVETGKNTANFVGGGNVTVTLTYFVGDGESKTVKQKLFVNNPLTDLWVVKGGQETGYIVIDDGSITLSVATAYAGTKPSDYTLKYSSSDESVATVDEYGVVTFKTTDGKAVITVTAVNSDGTDGVGCQVAIRNTQNRITQVADNVNVVLDGDSGEKTTFYPLPLGRQMNFTYEILSGSDVVAIDGDVLRAIKGGYATVKVSASESAGAAWSKQVEVFVHKSATELVVGNEDLKQLTLDTCKTEIAILPSILPSDAVYEKRIAYTYDASIADVSADGVIKFKKAGILTVTVAVVYDYTDENGLTKNVTECQKTLMVTSSYGRLSGFELTESGSLAQSEYEFYLGERQLTFEVKNVKPADFDISGKLTATCTNDEAISVSVSGNKVTVKGLKKGKGDIEIGVGDVKTKVSVNVKIKSESIKVNYGGSEVTSVVTLSNAVSLSAKVWPLNVSDATYTWTVTGGASFDGSVLTMPTYGTYSITFKSGDGASQTTVNVQYVADIVDFTLSGSGKTINSDDVFDLEWNRDYFSFSIQISPSAADFDWSTFEISVSDGRVQRDGKNVTVFTPSVADQPHFEGTVTVKYKNLKTVTFRLSRFGVQSVDFGDLDNNTDADFGLQQVRLFGNTSYYGGKVSYYKMKVNVSPASLYDKIVWTTSNSAVKVTGVSDGSVNVDFGSFAAMDENNVINDDFESKGLVTVSATDGKGNVFYSYVFHVVQGTNVFDFEGFKNSDPAVLHVNLGDDDEQAMIDSGTAVRMESYVGKSVVYGNGYLLNYNVRNLATSEETYEKWDWIGVSINRLYNASFKGANNSANKKDYNLEISGPSRVYYTELYNMYRGIQRSTAAGYIKRCIFRNMNFESIVLTAETEGAYVEDILVYDGGLTAMEAQYDTFSIKGFLDVYNFQNQDAFKDFSSLFALVNVPKELEKNFPDYVEKVNGEYYANIVVFSGKNSPTKRSVKFWNEATGQYEACDDGTNSITGGLQKMTYSIMGIGALACWSYPNTDDYPRYSDEFLADGTLNYTYMANRALRIKRLYTGD